MTIQKKPGYTPADLNGFDAERQLGRPGEYPFTRGIHPTMYRGKLWTMRQFAGFGSATDTNRRYKFLLEHGQTGLSVAFDFPTLMGYDSDHPRAEGEVGKCGVAISSLADMETLFDGIPLDKVSTSMTINGPAAILFCFYVAAAEKQRVPIAKLRGTVQNDILKEYMAQHAWVYPVEPALTVIVDMFEWGAKHTPLWNTISISGYHIREAGATAPQELAFTLANGFTYVERGIARGLDIDSFAARLSFFWDIHNDFFEEIAKLRAARRIWARHMRERYKAKQARSWMMRFHSQTAGVTLTAQQPLNNIVRVPTRRSSDLTPRRNAVAAHELPRRDAGTPHRAVGTSGAADAADLGARDGRRKGDRPVGRFLLRRVPDRSARARGGGAVRRDYFDRRRRAGDRDRLVPAADCPIGRRLPASSGNGRQAHRRRERIPVRRRSSRGDPQGLQRRRAGAAAPAGARARRAGQRTRGTPARGTAPGRGGRSECHRTDARLRARVREALRDPTRARARLGSLPRTRLLLGHERHTRRHHRTGCPCRDFPARVDRARPALGRHVLPETRAARSHARQIPDQDEKPRARAGTGAGTATAVARRPRGDRGQSAPGARLPRGAEPSAPRARDCDLRVARAGGGPVRGLALATRPSLPTRGRPPTPGP